jgi:hypothetical protein
VGRSLKDRPDEAYALLLKILREGWITHAPHNPNVSGNIVTDPEGTLAEETMFTTLQATCFCDIPADDLGIHVTKYGPFGLSFDRRLLAKRGARPVIYIPKGSLISEARLPETFAEHVEAPSAPDRPEEFDRFLEEMQAYAQKLLKSTEVMQKDLYDTVPALTKFDRIAKEFDKFESPLMKLCSAQLKSPHDIMRYHSMMNFITKLGRFLWFDIFCFVKVFDEQRSDTDPEQYYLEREWRVIGNVQFDVGDVVRVFLPKQYSRKFREDMPNYNGQITFTTYDQDAASA